MAGSSHSGFGTALGSYKDVVTTVGAMPGTYIALFLIGLAQGFIYLSVDKTGKITGEYTTETLIGDAVGFVAALLLIPFGIALLRHFTRAAPSYPSSLVVIGLKMIGWSIVLFVLVFLAIMAVVIPSTVIITLSQDNTILMILGGVLMLAGFVFLAWAGLRLALFYPMIARGEPSPIFGGFRRTKGSSFFIFCAFFFVFLFGLPLFAVLFPLQLSLFGLTFSDLMAGNILPMLEAQPLGNAAIYAVFSGIGTIFVTVLYAALFGRIFRAIHGIDVLELGAGSAAVQSPI